MNNKTNIENIKILESMIEEYKNCSVPEVDMQVNITFRERQAKAIENILADIERVLEENNKFMNAEVFSAKQVKFNEEQREKYFVHKSKVEQLQAKANKYDALAEKMKEKLKELKENDSEIYDTDSEDLVIAKYETRAIIDILQELLPKEE